VKEVSRMGKGHKAFGYIGFDSSCFYTCVWYSDVAPPAGSNVICEIEIPVLRGIMS
jgi:hypothetical protein